MVTTGQKSDKSSCRLSEPVSTANKRSSPFVGAAIDTVAWGDTVAAVDAVGVDDTVLERDSTRLGDRRALGDATKDT